MAQRDPLNEYKSEAFELFQQLIEQWHDAVITQMSRIEVRFQAPEPSPPPMQFQHADPNSGENEYPLGGLSTDVQLAPDSSVALAERDPRNPATWGRVGRNEPCPCGSGKKFKHCHGQVA